MRRSLKTKLLLSYLVIALVTVLVVFLVIRLTSGHSLMNLIVEQQTASLNEIAQNYFIENGSMDGFFDYYLRTNRSDPGLAPQNDIPLASDESQESVPPEKPESDQTIQTNPADDNRSNPPKDDRNLRGLYGLVDTEYKALIPTFRYGIGETVPEDMIQSKIAVKVDGETVAWILPDTSFQFNLSTEENLFLERTTLAVGLAALAGVGLAVIMGMLLAGLLLKPIQHLSKASQALAKGDLQQRVPVTSQDELGQLTETFNQMSSDLVRSDQQRKRLTADITHDLSTPLQVISGYVEMMEESGKPLKPERIEIIKTEIGYLSRLVGDLSMLTQVEANGLTIEPNPLQPNRLLQNVYMAYEPIAARQGIKLLLDIQENCPLIMVDEGRMERVIKNLVENALRYTPQDGTIELAVHYENEVVLSVTDSGSGIDAEDLPYVFDRFYRADKARGGNSGKMGLGLAICKALVTAQGGRIRAESPGRGQGASMLVSFPPIKEKTENE